MPVPVKLLMAAAQIAQTEQAQRVGRALLDAGSDAVTKRLKSKPVKAAKQKAISVEEQGKKPVTIKGAKTGWRGAVDRKVKFRSGQSGDLIRFIYTDEYDLKTERMVGNWSSDGKCLRGFCLNMKQECEFPVSGLSLWEDVAVGG